MTKRGPDSVTFALEEVIRMEDERIEEERLEQERKEIEAKEEKLREQKKRELLARAAKEAKKLEQKVITKKPEPAARIPKEEEFVFKKDIVPLRWYEKRNFKTAALAVLFALGIVAWIYGKDAPMVEKEFEEIPEYVTIQEYEELEGRLEYLKERIDKLIDKVRENEGIANEKHLQIYNRVGLYDIRAHERMDKLEDIIDKLDKPKKHKRRKAKKKPPKPKKEYTGLTDDPMGELELSETR